MIMKLIGVGLLTFTLGGAAAYVDSKAGPGTARESVNFGVGQTAGMIGEGANAVPRVIEQVRPALQSTMNQAGSVLGQQGTTQPRDDVVDPSDQGGQP